MNRDLTFDERLIGGTCAVLIEGAVCGTAWLVSEEGHLLTAGHLFPIDPYDSEVYIRFAEDIPRRAYVTVHAYHPPNGLDFAVLKLEHPPDDREPLPVSLSEKVSGQFRLYGYGKTLADRSVGYGDFLAPFDPQDVEGFRLFQLRSPELGEHGFSGGAVFSDALQAVVGIQIEATLASVGAGRDTVLAMPLYRISRTWRHLERFAERSKERRESDHGSDTASPASVASPVKRLRIFLSYKRDTLLDEPVALQLYEALRNDYDVFIDQKSMNVGVEWAKRIEEELRAADYFIPLLSHSSVHSEMVLNEIETACHLAQGDGRIGRPVILPVRIAFNDPFAYPLSSYLNHINWTTWNGPADTPRLIAELAEALSSGEFTRPARESKLSPPTSGPQSGAPPRPFPCAQLEMPEGTMDVESAFYVKRSGDDIAINAIRQKGVTITIKGPRQVGKSSLLIRIINEARRLGKEVVFIDFQQIGKTVLKDIESFLRDFCATVSDLLGIENKVDQYWSAQFSDIRRCTRYMERHILAEIASPVTLAMDEVDMIFDTPYRADFFGMLRSWHSSRAINPIWKKLDLTLVTSTEPYQFIDDLNQSPFNVGEIIEPADFRAEQVADLIARHGLESALTAPLLALLGGHPYLTRRALYLLAGGRVSTEALLATAAEDSGPFGDHLRYHLFRLHDEPDLIRGLLQIVRTGTCSDDRIVFRLQGAGLVRREAGRAVVARCKLYEDYFGGHLHA